MCIQETAGEGVSVSLSQFVKDIWRENKRSHFVECILMEGKYFCSQEKGKNLQKVFLKKGKDSQKFFSRKGKDSQKVFLKKRQSFAKVF